MRRAGIKVKPHFIFILCSAFVCFFFFTSFKFVYIMFLRHMIQMIMSNSCRTILDQLEAHEEAWPFLLPVNTKQFPTYKKIIRTPMDLSTIRKKLTDGM